VPLLQWILLKNRPHPMAWAGIALAFAGLVLLARPDTLAGFVGAAIGKGELRTLLGALAIALEIILIGKYAGRVDLQRVTVVQLLTAGLLAFAAMPLLDEPVPAFSWIWLASALGLGLASLLIQLTMNWAQQSVSPTRATLIYSSEPVWAGIAGGLAGERLPMLAFLGAALIVAGVLVSELRPRWPAKNSAQR
jgi:drug/metabolite transporter (DMT)-like permease